MKKKPATSKPKLVGMADEVKTLKSKLAELERVLHREGIISVPSECGGWASSLMEMYFTRMDGEKPRVSPGTALSNLSRRFEALCKHLGVGVDIEDQPAERIVVRKTKKK